MKIIESLTGMQAFSQQCRQAGRSIGFVPTMGALHEGHASLVQRARRENDSVVVSIFVNPLQFGPKENFRKYPRTAVMDLALLAKLKVDGVFMPAAGSVYPAEFSTQVRVPSLDCVLEGTSRPGHFQGVATVVAKLLNLVQPSRAYFGTKDYQQLRVIRRMVEDLSLPVRLVACATVREADGLAISSRNRFLSKRDREEAVKIHQALFLGRELISQKIMRDAQPLIRRLSQIFAKIPACRVDYVAVVDPETLMPMKKIDRPVLLAMAVRFGKTRLIDNIVIPNEMNDIETDFLILGSGIAGLSLAIKLSELGTVALVSKREFLEGSTVHAQGGVAAVMSPDDSFEQHIQDTLKAGAGLCREDIVRGVVQEGPARVRELIEWGMAFTKGARDEDSAYELGLEGGHSRRRVLHAGDYTGSEIAKTLLKKAQSCPPIQFYEYHIAVDLITTDKVGAGLVPARTDTRSVPTCLGAYVLNIRTGKVQTFLGRRATFLATGGAGKVYLYTTNPDVSSGDGIAMGFRAGAVIANMEFVQFHPTCLYHPEAKSFLISEALRGEGGILKLEDGTAFMEAYHPDKELAPRDIVARAIDHELKKRGDKFVYLDIRHKGADFIKKRFPSIYRQCLQFGIDMTKEMIPVVPAAHYFCGGVQTDDVGRTSVERLWAIGEVASTGLHGANRLASNSLLEGLVFAHRAYETILQSSFPAASGGEPMGPRQNHSGVTSNVPPWNPGKARDSDEQVVIAQNWAEIRQLMWNYVGIVRSNKRLDRAYRRIGLLQQEIHEYYWDFLITPDLIELRNIATVAELVVRSAMMRKESRGLHYNLDHPKLDDQHGRHDTAIQKPITGTTPALHFV